MKKSAVFILAMILSSYAAFAVTGDSNSLPVDFPHITTRVYDSNLIGTGKLFLTIGSEANNVGNYLAILNNDGTPYFLKDMGKSQAYDFKMQPNGLTTFAQLYDCSSYDGNNVAVHKVMNRNYKVIDSFQMGNGYLADFRDYQILPNGHTLLFGNHKTEGDINEPVEGCEPNIIFCGAVVQELDTFKNVVFQWRASDYFGHDDMNQPQETNQPDISQLRPNSIHLENDGNILLAGYDRIIKINRCTGDIIWQFGGDANDFVFIHADPNEPNAANVYFGCTDFSMLPNGNILIYDNGTRDGTTQSKVLEYKLDDVNKTAELDWRYFPDPNYGLHDGSAQRLPNGNTLISRSAVDGNSLPACMEITPDGRIVFEVFIDSNEIESFRAYRFPFPPDELFTEVTQYEFATGNTYKFANSKNDTGVSMKVNYIEGDLYNNVTVRREPFAPIYPEFPGTDHMVLPVRVIISQFAIMAINADVSFDVKSFSFADPNTLTVYYRQYRDKGLFIPLPTVYNYATGKLRASFYAQTSYEDDIGEFIFCYPDISQSAEQK